MYKLLMVEDDEEICEILQFYLLKNDEYQLTTVHSAEKALPIIKTRQFDLVLLDIMLPGLNGMEFCTQLREVSFCPVIFMSCLNDDDTIIKALNMGGDDYLVKPFQAPVLMAKIEAHLRRAVHREAASAPAGSSLLRLDSEKHKLYKNGRPVRLSPTEYELICFLMNNPNRFIPFEEIYETVWQKPSLGDNRALFVHISHLRQKLEDNPAEPVFIKTHMRGGYIFSEG